MFFLGTLLGSMECRKDTFVPPQAHHFRCCKNLYRRQWAIKGPLPHEAIPGVAHDNCDDIDVSKNFRGKPFGFGLTRASLWTTLCEYLRWVFLGCMNDGQDFYSVIMQPVN